MKRILISILALLLPTVATANTPVTLEQVNQSYNTIKTHLNRYDSIFSIDEELLQHQIDILTAATKQMQFDVNNYALILSAQLDAAQAINKKYSFSDMPMDTSQVQGLLDDLDMLIEKTDVNLANELYTAGHIAAHQLENSDLAYRYWSKCAENEHAGCMNILASSYESGAFIVEQNLEKAVYWHSKVVDTGTHFTCAGFLSAIRLAYMSASHVDTLQTTEYWLNTVTELRTKLVTDFETPDICGIEKEYLTQAILSANKTEWLEKAKAITFDQNDKTEAGKSEWISSFSSATSLENLKPVLEMLYSDYDRCEFVEDFALLHRDHKVHLDDVLNYMKGFSDFDCAEKKATVRRLQQALILNSQ